LTGFGALPLESAARCTFRRVIGAVGVGIALLVMASDWSKSSFSRFWVGLTWVLVIFLLLKTFGAVERRQGAF